MSWLKRLVNTVSSGRVEREIRRELEFHVAERADELRSSGLSPEEAERRARVKLGNPLLQAERTRDVDIALGAERAARILRAGPPRAECGRRASSPPAAAERTRDVDIALWADGQ